MLITFKWIAIAYTAALISALWTHRINKESTKITNAILVIGVVASNSALNLDLVLLNKICFAVPIMVLIRCCSIIIKDLRRKQQANRPLEKKTESKE